VTANVAGTIYFVEGSVTVKSVSDITNAHSTLWAQGAVAVANTPTSIAIDVDKVLNGYYRVFVMTAQGVLSAPATNIVTISVPRAYETATRVRRQTLDQDHSKGDSNVGALVISTQTIGQSFTAGLSGPLSRVSCALWQFGATLDVMASLYATDDFGKPTGAALAASSVSATSVPTTHAGALTNLTKFDFSVPYSVVAGRKYVIVLTSLTDVSQGFYYSWVLEDRNFSGGNTAFNDPLGGSPTPLSSLVFQTYVDI
jgi:hypothetical protein